MIVAIVGGGAAGLMAAATILEQSPATELILLERNDVLGKKVTISGGGRCNVTTGIQDVRTVLSKYPRGSKFLSSAMYQFPPEAVFQWFEEHGVPLKIEEDLRVFPQSDQGQDIVAVFERLFRSKQVSVLLNTSVKGIKRINDTFELTLGNGAPTLSADAVILTTGGQAYRQTGSTGDGYAFAQSLGHSLTRLAPSLNAFFTKETWPAEVAGVSFQAVKMSAKRGKGYSYTGPILFTHKGITGPAVFALSSQVAFELYDVQRPLDVVVDLFPHQSFEQLFGSLMEAALSQGKKSLQNILALFVPKSLAFIACQQTQLNSEQRANEVNKKQWQAIAVWLKGIPLQAIGRGAGDEFVTAGGIPLEEVDPSTMQSKICPGLFFAGEILDIDGYTGGFNLQASWATGRLAGRSVGLANDEA